MNGLLPASLMVLHSLLLDYGIAKNGNSTVSVDIVSGMGIRSNHQVGKIHLIMTLEMGKGIGVHLAVRPVRVVTRIATVSTVS